jgi:hypothetical protein
MSYRRWVSLACLCRSRAAHRRRLRAPCRTFRPRIPQPDPGSPSVRRRSPTSASARSMSSTRRTLTPASVSRWLEVAAEAAVAAEVAEGAEAAAEVAAVVAAAAAVAVAACPGAVAPSARPGISDCVDIRRIETAGIVRCDPADDASALPRGLPGHKHITRALWAFPPAQGGRVARPGRLRMRVLP